VEQQVVTGIAFSKDEARFNPPCRRQAGRAAASSPARRSQYQRRMIVQNVSSDGAPRISPSRCRASDYEARPPTCWPEAKPDIGYDRIDGASDVAKVSVIGIGMRSHAGVAARAFKALAERRIKHPRITTSEIKFSLLIDRRIYGTPRSERCHSLYDLDKN